jgi:hypothetical protein
MKVASVAAEEASSPVPASCAAPASPPSSLVAASSPVAPPASCAAAIRVHPVRIAMKIMTVSRDRMAAR